MVFLDAARSADSVRLLCAHIVAAPGRCCRLAIEALNNMIIRVRRAPPCLLVHLTGIPSMGQYKRGPPRIPKPDGDKP
jgi:hypothetical protein